MKSATGETIILWASYFDELSAVSFLHEFRQMGAPVTLVAIDYAGERGGRGVVSVSQQNLRQTVAMAERIACLIIPASAAALTQFRQDPVLWQLLAVVHENGGRIVIGRAEGRIDPGLASLLPPSSYMIVYPQADKLLLFARWLVHGLVMEEELGAARTGAKIPPLIRVAANSIPGDVAGAIAGIIRDYGFAEAQAIGAAAGNQMLKATAIAKSYLAADQMSLFAIPDFVSVIIDDYPRSAIRLFVSAWPTGRDNWFGWEQVQTVEVDKA